MLKIRKHRKLNLIIKEMDIVTYLITMNQDCCEKFPEDHGLKLNLYSLKKREKELLRELFYSIIPFEWK
jgi:hypothetical protein